MGTEGGLRAVLTLVGVSVGVLLTYFTAISSHSQELVRLSEQVSEMRRQLDRHTAMQYTQQDATKDLGYIQAKLAEHDRCFQKIDQLIEAHEKEYHE